MYQTKFDLFSGSITDLADDVVAVDLFGELSTTPWIYIRHKLQKNSYLPVIYINHVLAYYA